MLAPAATEPTHVRRWRGRLAALLLACDLCGCGYQVARPRPRHAVPPPSVSQPNTSTFTATAYSGGGRTALGTRPRAGIVAADPSVLPLGSRIRVSGAGPYSGQYVVRDTGRKIRGRKIDIYISHHHQAKRFGRHAVKVEVLHYGSESASPRFHRAYHTRRRHHHRPRHRRYRSRHA